MECSEDSRHPLPLPALPFLPVVHCVQCSKCGVIKKTGDGMKRHLRDCYSTESPGKGTDPASGAVSKRATPVFAQTIYGGRNTSWFPVISENSTTILQLLQLDQGSPPGSTTENPAPHLDSFLSEMRFDVQLKMHNLTMDDAYNASKWCTAPPYPHARRILASYIHNAFSVAAQKAYIKAHTFLDSPLRLVVSTETMRAYISRLSCLLTFLFSLSDSPTNKRNTIMTNAQQHEINEFKNMCSSADANLTPALSKFHIIVRSIMFDPLDSNQNVTPLFIACAAVKRSSPSAHNQGDAYRFANAQETSPMLAALKYLAKCAVVTHIYAFPRSGRDREEAWKQITSATSEHADSGATIVASNLRCCHRLASSESHHINVVICTRHSMCGIVDGHELSLAFVAAQVHKLQHLAWSLMENKMLMGLHLSKKFWKTLSTLQDAPGEKSPGYWYLMHPNNYESLNAWRRAYINAVHPHLFNADASVKVESAEEFVKNAIQLQHHIYSLMQLCSGGPARATEAATLRIRNTAKATRSIFVSQGQIFTILTYSKTRCMQDGTGRPIVRCPDSVTAGMMHIYMLLIHPLHVLLDAKLQEQTEPAVLPVMLPPPSRSGVAAERHSVSNPSGSVAISAGNGNDTINPLDFIFDTSSPDRLRTAFTSCLSSVNIPLTTTQYRHYHSAVVKNFLPTAAAAWQTSCSEDQSASPTLHLQAGHTEHTATKTYGVTRSQLTAITGSEMQQYRNASETWHRVLRLPSGNPIPFTDKKHPYSFGSPIQSNQLGNASSGPQKHHAPCTNHLGADSTEYSVNGGNSSNGQVTTAQILARLDCIEHNLSILVSKESEKAQLENCPSPLKPVSGETNSSIPTKRKATPSSSDKLSAGASLSLQTFLQSPDANFTSPEQKTAVLHCLQPAEDLLVVLPTGGGKSLLFMLPAFMKPEKVCVVLVPLVSLQQDLIHRCAKKGVTAARFPDVSHTPGARIVLVSAEHLVLPSYTKFLRTTSATKTLHAIYVDEAHLIILWKHFRTSLQDVREFIRPHDITVPIVSMTATCPPSLEKSVSHACGMREWQTIRSPTVRANIRYSVRQVSASSLLLTAAQIIARIANECNDVIATMRMIVYIQNKSRCNAVEHVFSLICPHIHCLLYHADLTDAQRSNILQNWKARNSTKPRLMIATSAFGCGIDVPSVRCVIHLGMPSTVIDFLQESGRAGRDGFTAQSIILHQPLTSAEGFPNRKVDGEPCNNAPASLSSAFGSPTALCTTPRKDCRRWFIDTFIDGTRDKRSCYSRNLEPCDHCEAQYGDKSDDNRAHTGRDNKQLVNGGSSTGNDDQRNQTTAVQSTGMNSSQPHDQQPNHQASARGASSIPSEPSHADLDAENQTENPVLSAHLRDTAATTPAALRELADRLAGTCAPCSVATKSLIRHKRQSGASCFKNLCLRCCGAGHKASMCPNLILPANLNGCYSCTLSKVEGKVVHNAGTYGKRNCQLKTVFRFCIRLWESDEHRSSIHQRIPATVQFQTTTEFVVWLRSGTSFNTELGILPMVALILSMFFNE